MDLVIQFRGTVYENGYGQIAQKVMRDKTIHTTAKAIYAYLCSFAGGGLEVDRSAFPSVALIMDELNIKSEDTFYKYRKQLVDAGYITVDQKRDEEGKFLKNIYYIEAIVKPKKVVGIPKSKDNQPHPKKSGTDRTLNYRARQNRGSVKSGTNINSLLIKTSFNKDDDEDINKQNIFIHEFVEEAKERNIPVEEIKEVVAQLQDTHYHIQALDNTLDKVLPKYAAGEVSKFSSYFISVLKREQRRLDYVSTQPQQESGTKGDFPFYNWLEGEK